MHQLCAGAQAGAVTVALHTRARTRCYTVTMSATAAASVQCVRLMCKQPQAGPPNLCIDQPYDTTRPTVLQASS